MQQLQWKTLSEDELLSAVAPTGAANHRERVDAYERVRGTDSVLYTPLRVPSNTKLSLDLVFDEPGVHFLDITQEQGSTLTLTHLEKSENETPRVVVIRTRLHRNAHLESFTACFGSASTVIFQETILEHDASTTNQRTVFFGTGAQQLDIFSTTTLLGKATRATITARGIAADKAQVRFDGGISIEQSAIGAAGHLFEHTLLLSPDARMNAIPALKIGTNEVQASHSASVTRIDDEHLLYCMCRGIDEQTATRMIAEGFIMREVPEDQLLTIHPLLDAKLCSL